MGQVTIYLNDDLEAKMNNAVKSMNISKSKWIAKLIKEKISTDWPDSVKDLVGSWKDFPTAEEIRSARGKDIKRESL